MIATNNRNVLYYVNCVSGGEIVSTFDDPAHVKLGHCKRIEEVIIGEDKLIKFSGEYYFALNW